MLYLWHSQPTTKQGKVTKDLISPTKYRTPLRGSLYSLPPTRQAEICHVCSIPFPSLSFTDIFPNKTFVLQTLSQLLLPGDPTSTDTNVRWDLWQWPKGEKRPCRRSHKTFDGDWGKRRPLCYCHSQKQKENANYNLPSAYYVPATLQMLLFGLCDRFSK